MQATILMLSGTVPTRSSRQLLAMWLRLLCSCLGDGDAAVASLPDDAVWCWGGEIVWLMHSEHGKPDGTSLHLA